MARAGHTSVVQGVVSGLLGFGVGVLLSVVAARVIVRRSLSKVRAAERRARSAERLAELGSMTGGLAHEIKNPLSTIGLNAQLLAEGVQDLGVPEETKGRLARRVDSLKREVERLRGILTDFLEYAGELRLDPRGANVNEVVSELVDFFLPQAERSGVRLRMDLAPGSLEASIDVPHVKQAILNLMLNAVQAMASMPATATRELILKTHAQIEADSTPCVVVHVIDTGPGIAAEVREKIFSPYFTTKSGGTGLGLPTTRRIVEAHHGRIEVHGEPGRGTDFVLFLPRDSKGAPAPTKRRLSSILRRGGAPA